MTIILITLAITGLILALINTVLLIGYNKQQKGLEQAQRFIKGFLDEVKNELDELD